ncbi:MAG: hypothetical protein PHY99_03295 [Bacteroidales bacterium]|nr:hypothetical protein [Bacteroidales bacterium]
MKSKILKPILSLAGLVLLMLSITGCKGLFDNPLKDKDTGKNITALLIDRNFITLKINIRLEDMSGNAVTQENVQIRLLGEDSVNFITFAGERQATFTTNSGFIEVGCDPNRVINAQHPLEFTIVAIGPNHASMPQFVSYTTDGVKNLTISMISIGVGKSMNFGGYNEPFDMTFNGVKNSSELEFLLPASYLTPTGTDYQYVNWYLADQAGTLICDNLTDNRLYSDYGVYFLCLTSSSYHLPNSLPLKNTGNGINGISYVYSAILRSGVAKCTNGLTINVDRSGGGDGTGVFDYLITFSDGSTKNGQITCTFPSSNLIEQIYYPASNPAVTVALSGDAQYDMSPPVNLSSACGGVATFVATPKSNLKVYRMAIQYKCPQSDIGIGLSIVGEFRKTGATGDWTSFASIEGVCELQLELNADYDFRVNVEGEYHNFVLPTNPALVEDALRDQQSADYQLISLVITPTTNKTIIEASVQFSQGICDILD